jgi:hypothetical protein
MSKGNREKKKSKADERKNEACCGRFAFWSVQRRKAGGPQIGGDRESSVRKHGVSPPKRSVMVLSRAGDQFPDGAIRSHELEGRGLGIIQNFSPSDLPAICDRDDFCPPASAADQTLAYLST